MVATFPFGVCLHGDLLWEFFRIAFIRVQAWRQFNWISAFALSIYSIFAGITLIIPTFNVILNTKPNANVYQYTKNMKEI